MSSENTYAVFIYDTAMNHWAFSIEGQTKQEALDAAHMHASAMGLITTSDINSNIKVCQIWPLIATADLKYADDEK